MAMVEKIKNKLRGNGFLLAVTIVLFFVLYIAGAILYGNRNFTSPISIAAIQGIAYVSPLPRR